MSAKRSKYDEISLNYRQSRKTFLDYQRECQIFARDLVDGMVEYFEWPQEQEITYIPLGEELDPNNRFYAISGAMRMDQELFWHFGLELTVQEPGGAHPMPFLLSFFIKKIGPHFVVKLGSKSKEIRIHEDRRSDLAPFYDAVYVQIMNFFTQRYQEAITIGLKEPGFIMLSPKSSNL